MDYSAGLEFTKEQYHNIIRQVKEIYTNRGYDKVRLLTIVSTKEPHQGKELCQGVDNYWIVDEQSGRLIIYEDQPGTFIDVKDIVDTGLLEYLRTIDTKEEFLSNKVNVPLTKRIKQFSLFNSIIIGINIFIFLVIEITGSTNDTEYMLRWGALYWPSVIELHQYYRTFTHMFLHFGIQHLLNNMIVLGVIGDNLERLVGKGKYLFIYLSAGILAGLASMVYNMVQDTIAVSAGASGAIFGVVGAMLYIVAVNRGRVEDISTKQLGLFALLSLYSGFTNQGVDNTAHIGGFLAGIILAMIVYRRPKMEGRME
jgi:rhomboid protease GluP